MPQIDVNGVSLYHEERGSGPPVVFSHGLLWSCRMFDAQVEALAGQYRCISYDHRGQGKSEVPGDRAIDMDTLADDAAALIEAKGAAPCHFVGLSMGGFVGLRLAARRPGLVRTLSLLDTTAGPEPAENLPRYRLLNWVTRLGGLRLAAGQVMPILYGRTFLDDPARAEERESCWRHLLSNRRTIYRAVNGVLEREGMAGELGAIRAPTLVLVGEEDVATPPRVSEQLQAGIAGARLVRVPGAGHSSPVEQPAPVTEALRAFFNEAGTG